jgi:hypothetical protein
VLDLTLEKIENFFLHPSDFVCKMQKIASDFIKIDAFRMGKNERKHVTIFNRMSYVLPEITRQTEKARN